ncbi:MAG: hypothetical protein PHH08_05220 [Candidatus ainarchaeum sp.]|nr:hypothetical protein [Candidatus ainarchaeum sp.]
MRIGKIVLAGILGGIAIFVISTALSYFFQAVFGYDVLSLGGMRAVNDPVMVLFFAYPFVISFVVAILFERTRKSFGGSVVSQGLSLGLLAWLVSSIPSAFIVFSSMNYPIGFTANSLAGPLIYMIIAGIIIAKIMQ